MEQSTRLTIQVTYSCGCGAVTHDPAKARVHVNEKGHAMTVNGTIRPNEETRKRVKKFYRAVQSDDLDQ